MFSADLLGYVGIAVVEITILIGGLIIMFEALKAQIARLVELLPQLTQRITGLETENAALKARIAELEANAADLPNVEAALQAQVDAIAALAVPAA